MMEHNDTPRAKARESFLALLLAALCGGGFLLFLIFVSGGFFFYVLCAAATVAVLGLLNYVLWGQAMSRAVAGEREEEEAREHAEAKDRAHNGVQGRRRF
jgi:hypothetical protein